MKLIYFVIYIFINLYCFSVISQTIAIINVQSLIDNNTNYKKILKEIEINREKYLDNFQEEEKELNKILNEIESSKLILSDSEINIQINDYNKQFEEYRLIVDEFNYHYQNQIIKIRENILKEIIVLLEKYAIENNVDLILDSTAYLIASNSLNITENIKIELENLNLKLEYKTFEEN